MEKPAGKTSRLSLAHFNAHFDVTQGKVENVLCSPDLLPACRQNLRASWSLYPD